MERRELNQKVTRLYKTFKETHVSFRDHTFWTERDWNAYNTSIDAITDTFSELWMSDRHKDQISLKQLKMLLIMNHKLEVIPLEQISIGMRP